jgi:hypothetical protein
VLEQHRAIRTRPHEISVMRRDDDGSTLASQLGQRVCKIFATGAIQGGRRLVHQEHRRIDGKRTRDRNTLRLAARQLMGLCVSTPAHAEHLEKVSRTAFRLRTRSAEHVHWRQRNIVKRAEMGEQMMELKDDAH